MFLYCFKSVTDPDSDQLAFNKGNFYHVLGIDGNDLVIKDETGELVCITPEIQPQAFVQSEANVIH